MTDNPQEYIITEELLGRVKSVIIEDANHEYATGFFKQIRSRPYTSATHAPAPDEQQQISDIIKDLEQSLDFYKSRMDMLQCWQSSMRDPERKILCDILANGYTLTTKEEIDTLHTTKEEP